MALNDTNVQSHSIINPSICVRGANAVGSQLTVTVEQTNHGFVPGMAIRWNSGVDGATAQYNKAFANNPYNAEALGVVGNVLGPDAFELVMGGVVVMNEEGNNFFGQSIGSGLANHDVFFLSGTTAGHLTPIRPNSPGFVAKPMITRLAEDAQGRVYGVVTNYVGSHIGGNAAVSLDNLIPAGTIQAYAGSSPPRGWSLCDGDGSGGESIPGIKVSENPDYFNNVGLRYGWVELLFLGENQGLPVSDVGNYITATTNGKTIAGSVVGVSGDYVYVKQSDNDSNVPDGANSNFVTFTDENNQQIRTRGAGNLQATERCIIQVPEIFPKSAVGQPATLIRGSGDSQALILFQDNSNKAGVYSCLAPDLRGKVIWGAKEPDTFGGGENDTDVLARSGGAEEISLDFTSTSDDGVPGGSSQQTDPADDGWANSQTNLPPFLTTNWIVRTSSTANAAITDRLSVSTLLLTGLPTTGDDAEQFTVFRDTTDNSLKIQPDAPS